MRHDDPVNLLAACMKEVLNDVAVEPQLLPLSGEALRGKSANREVEARSDIRAKGFWTRCMNAFFDVRVFYPFASSYVSSSLKALFKRFEMEKKKQYGERIREVDHGSFTPLVFSSCGGMGREAEVVVKKLAAMLATKRNEPYAKVITWLRCRLSFSLARSAVRCVRGSRSIRRSVQVCSLPTALVLAECQISG